MRKSNVDTSKIPKFDSHQEAKDYFDKFGKIVFFGTIGGFDENGYYVYTLDHKDGRRFFLDIYNSGKYVLTLRQSGHDF